MMSAQSQLGAYRPGRGSFVGGQQNCSLPTHHKCADGRVFTQSDFYSSAMVADPAQEQQLLLRREADQHADRDGADADEQLDDSHNRSISVITRQSLAEEANSCPSTFGDERGATANVQTDGEAVGKSNDASSDSKLRPRASSSAYQTDLRGPR